MGAAQTQLRRRRALPLDDDEFEDDDASLAARSRRAAARRARFVHAPNDADMQALVRRALLSPEIAHVLRSVVGAAAPISAAVTAGVQSNANEVVMTLREWLTGPRPAPQDMVAQASSTDGRDAWTEHPIGISWAWSNTNDKSVYGPHDQLLFVAIRDNTDRGRRGAAPVNRGTIVRALASAGFPNRNLPGHEYAAEMPKHKFVASPEGNGVDCHRTYEALMAGCVPILEANPKTLVKYAGLPVLWTLDFTEVTPAYLDGMYARMLDTKYDFSRMFLHTYPANVQRDIRAAGNHWWPQFHGRKYYDV